MLEAGSVVASAAVAYELTLEPHGQSQPGCVQEGAVNL